jgi:hypothetical protein
LLSVIYSATRCSPNWLGNGEIGEQSSGVKESSLR